jgi:predicted TIM-barrel fold metal-dependent hydrolase
MRTNDAHCHFFSRRFFDQLFEAVVRQNPKPAEPPNDRLVRAIGWEAPQDNHGLAERWVRELDRYGVARAMLIASVAGDEQSVAEAVADHPDRFVGAFMFDPTASDARERLTHALGALRLRVVCLFPAMHRYPLHDPRVNDAFDTAAENPGTAIFVHCGVLSVGIRTKLGLPSPFEMRFGNPLDLHGIAARHPQVPIIIPHFGAGLFRETLMLADACANVHLDTSSSNGWIKYHPGLTHATVFAQALAVVGPRRLLFGTDSSYFPRGWQQAIHDEQRRIVEGLATSADEGALIFGGNFDRLF